MIHVITADNFESEVENSPIPCVIGFTASWCDLCPKMLETLEALSQNYAESVKFCAVDIDHEGPLRIMFAVAALPYTVLVADGMKTPLFDELVTEERLAERIDYVLEGGKCPNTSPLRREGKRPPIAGRDVK